MGTVVEKQDQAFIQYKRELARWQRENRNNIALFKTRVDQYKRRKKLYEFQKCEIARNYTKTVESINSRYEALMQKRESAKVIHDLDIERRAEIGRALCLRDQAFVELGEAPQHPEFVPTPGKPQPPFAL